MNRKLRGPSWWWGWWCDNFASSQ